MIIKRELYFKEVEAEEFYRIISAIQDFFDNMKEKHYSQSYRKDDLNHFPGNVNVLTDIAIEKLIENLDVVESKYEDFIDYIKKENIGRVVFKEIEANNFGFVDIQGVLICENGESHANSESYTYGESHADGKSHVNSETVNIFSRVSNVGWNFFCDDEEVEKIFFERN